MTYKARISIIHSPARIHLVPEKQKLSFLLFWIHYRHTVGDPEKQDHELEMSGPGDY